MQVTDAMVDAAAKQLWSTLVPGIVVREALRGAIQAAYDAAPWEAMPKMYAPGGNADVTDATDASEGHGLGVSTPTAPGSITTPLDGDRAALKLVGPSEIADHLGVSLTQVDEWIRRAAAIRFPEPHNWLSGIPRWLLGTIDQWHQHWKGDGDG